MSVLFCLALFVFVEPGRIVGIMLSAHPAGFVFVIAVCFVSLVVSCVKWKSILKKSCIDLPVYVLVAYYLVGYYFNNFLPTSIGGDGVRILLLGKRVSSLSIVAVSVFVERVTGFLAVDEEYSLGLDYSSWIVLVLGFVVLFFAFVLVKRIRNVLTGLFDFVKKSSVLDFVFWGFLSVLFQLLVVLVYYFSGIALSIDISIQTLLFVVPLVSLATLIPVSLNGLGLREASFAYLLSFSGVEPENAISMSLFVYFVSIIFSALGGFIFINLKSRASFEGK